MKMKMPHKGRRAEEEEEEEEETLPLPSATVLLLVVVQPTWRQREAANCICPGKAFAALNANFNYKENSSHSL